MAYKLLNLLFGWDYIAWWDKDIHNRNSDVYGIARVHVNLDGYTYYWLDKRLGIYKVIQYPESVLWLTCSNCKYFPDGVNT